MEARILNLKNKYQYSGHSGPKFNFPTSEATTDAIQSVVESVKSIVTEAVASITTTMQTPTIGLSEESNSSIAEMNTTAIEEMISSNATFLEVADITDGTGLIADNDTSIMDVFMTSELPDVVTGMDWLGDFDRNLTMAHDPHDAGHDQTLYIILGGILGVLVAITLILLLIYVTYKRSNFYTLQERASCSSHRVVSMQCAATDDFEKAIEEDKSGYKF